MGRLPRNTCKRTACSHEGATKNTNFHVLCPEITVDSRTTLYIREKQLGVLISEYLEAHWDNIVDERVLTMCLQERQARVCL